MINNYCGRVIAAATIGLVLAGAVDSAGANKKKKSKAEEQKADPYAELVWPRPPDKPRIKLESVFKGRVSVEAKGSKWKKLLIGASPQQSYDRLRKPHSVAFDPEGRILVSDTESGFILRFDQEGERLDVLGAKGATRLAEPAGMTVDPNGIIYIADMGAGQVIAIDAEGELLTRYGRAGELVNPVDVALAPNGNELYVADSKAHRIAVFDIGSGEELRSIGSQGDGAGEFAFPTAVAFTLGGDLLVVDQLNARIQMFDRDDEYVDQLGGRGVGFGHFVRPKDIAVDDAGFIYITDFAYNNVQIFDADFTLLTFVGQSGLGPGGFHGISGVATQGDRFALVDQLGRRCQVFRFIASKTAE